MDALKKATAKGYNKGKGSKTTRNRVFMVQGNRLKNTRNGLLVESQILPISNFDLIDAASALAIKEKLQMGLYERSVAETT